MKTRMSIKVKRLLTIGVTLLLLMSCDLVNTGKTDSFSPAEQTAVAEAINKTSVAVAVLTQNAALVQQPTYTPYPTYTIVVPDTPVPPPIPTNTVPAAPAVPTATLSEDLLQRVEISASEFYCGYAPKEVTIEIYTSDITKGFALYYSFEDLVTKAKTDNVKMDIHRNPAETFRYVRLLGDPAAAPDYYSAVVNVPATMGPAKMVYQIISDDGTSNNAYSDITYYPCGYVKP
jgi:hypothetical protein